MNQMERVLRAVIDGHRTAAMIAAALGSEPAQMASYLSILSKRGAVRITGKVRVGEGHNYANTWSAGPLAAEALMSFAQAKHQARCPTTKPEPATESNAAIERRYQAAMRVIRARRWQSSIDERTVLIKSSLRADGVFFRN